MSLLSFAKKISQRGEKQTGASAKKTAGAAVATRKKAAEANEKKVVAPAVRSLRAARIGLTPVISEKSMAAQVSGTVVFRVRPEATKGQIMAAVAERYNVMPRKVRTYQLRGKRRQRGATSGFTAAWKKAYVSLPAGAQIDVTA